jgi:hypothetical protein
MICERRKGSTWLDAGLGLRVKYECLRSEPGDLGENGKAAAQKGRGTVRRVQPQQTQLLPSTPGRLALYLLVPSCRSHAAAGYRGR